MDLKTIYNKFKLALPPDALPANSWCLSSRNPLATQVSFLQGSQQTPELKEQKANGTNVPQVPPSWMEEEINAGLAPSWER